MKKNDYYGKTLMELYYMNRKNVLDFYELYRYFSLNIFKYIKVLEKSVDFWENYDFYYKNSKEYIEAQQYYNLVLEEVFKLFKELNCDNEMKLFAGYSYLLKQGYLSQNHEFYYSRLKDDSEELLGVNVMLGKGCCRHINTMLRDLLRVSGYSSCNMEIMLNNEKLLCLNNMKFLQTRDENNSDSAIVGDVRIGEVNFTFYNHLVTLFYDEIQSYIMDAVNDTIYSYDSKLGVCQNGVVFRANCDVSIDWDEEIKLGNILRPTFKGIMESKICDYYKIWASCFDLTDVFEKFYQEHKELYQEVVEKKKVLLRESDKYNIFK